MMYSIGRAMVLVSCLDASVKPYISAQCCRVSCRYSRTRRVCSSVSVAAPRHHRPRLGASSGKAAARDGDQEYYQTSDPTP